MDVTGHVRVDDAPKTAHCNLQNNRISSKGAVLILEAIEKNPKSKLTYLNLSGNKKIKSSHRIAVERAVTANGKKNLEVQHEFCFEESSAVASQSNVLQESIPLHQDGIHTYRAYDLLKLAGVHKRVWPLLQEANITNMPALRELAASGRFEAAGVNEREASRISSALSDRADL